MKRLKKTQSYGIISLTVFFLITSIIGCGRTTTHTMHQPIAVQNTNSGKYYVESCECKDKDAKRTVCDELIAQLRYFLLKKGLLDDKNGNKKIDMTITDYRDVPSIAHHLVGVLAGSDNLSVSVFITDIERDKRIADFTVSSDDYTGNEVTSKILIVAQEIVRVVSGDTE